MKKTSIIAMLLAAVCATSCFVGGTFAKYTSTVSGTATATVAKWDIEIDGTKLTEQNKTLTVDLFTTINDTDGSAEDDVDAGKIAPGTQGSFDFSFESNSEVTVEYTIDYTVINTANIPVQFSVDNGTTWTNDLENVAKTELADATTETVTIQWKWAYETLDGESNVTAGDTADTLLGIAAPELSVTINATFTQKD